MGNYQMDFRFKPFAVPFNDGSVRHHYIPEYFIKGFGDDLGKLAMYDKRADRYLAGTKSPKQLFYVTRGNASTLNGRINTIAETVYSQLDIRECEFLKEFLACPNIVNGISNELHSYMHVFMVNQYFRVPSNEGKYDALYRSAPTWARQYQNQPDLMRALEGQETMKKVTRAFLPYDLFMRLLSQAKGKEVHKVFEPGAESLILTDNPVVFLREPVLADDILAPCMLAVSKHRLCVVDSKVGLENPREAAIAYNALAIEQADRIVCASSMKILKAMVEMWKGLRAGGFFPLMRNYSYRIMTKGTFAP